jgi:hypothetical protein
MFTVFSREKLISLSRVCFKEAAMMDGLWFSAVEDEYGLDAAVRLGEKVWENVGFRQAKSLRETLGLEGETIRAFIETFKLTPFYNLFKPEVRKASDSSAILRFVKCPPQMARVKSGKGEFPCKSMGLAYFKSFVQPINPKIKVKCLTAPPDSHPKEYCCEWEFTLD